MNCSSSPVPSVVTTSAWVSPRVNSAEPWVRGSRPASATIGRTVVRSRPSIRRPVDRMSPRTTSDSRPLKQPLTADSSSASSSVSPSRMVARAAAMAVWRSCLSVMAKAARIAPSPSSLTRAASAEVSAGWKSNGSFAASSARSMIRSVTGCMASWPKVTAPSISASDSS